jgi:dTMP kinase
MKRAKIIVIEGTDGSGKETQSKKVEKYLSDKGFKVKRFSFPVYNSPTGKIVGASYLGKPELGESVFPETSAYVDPIVSSLYYAADRRYNFLKEIEEEIYKNDYIILDRYTTSNMGHQAGKAKTKKEKDKILNFIEKLEFDLCELPRPDIVVFLHMPYEATIELRKDRASGDGNENNPEHLINAEKTYLYIAKKYNWKNINCIKTKKYTSLNDIKSIDEISLEVIDTIKNVKTINKISKMERF